VRASEFVTESTVGSLSKRAEQASQGITKMRDVGGYDRTNWLNRAMMAVACADGKDTKKIPDIDAYSWAEKYNTAHPYTKEEWKMMKQMLATVPTDSQTLVPWSQSEEMESTNKQSPIQGFKGYAR
jgi:hypothetical protein